MAETPEFLAHSVENLDYGARWKCLATHGKGNERTSHRGVLLSLILSSRFETLPLPRHTLNTGLLGRRVAPGVPASHEQRGRAEGDRIVCEHAAHAPAASLRAGRGVRERAPRECPSRELLGPEAELYRIRVGSQPLRERHVRSRPILPTLEAMRMGCGLCRGHCPGRLPGPGRGPGRGHGRLFVSKFEPRGSQGKSKAPRGFSLGSSQAAPSIRNGRSPGQQRDALWLPLFP